MEIWTKNLITIKRQDRVKDEKLQYFAVHWKISFLGGGGGGGGHEKPVQKGGLPEKREHVEDG